MPETAIAENLHSIRQRVDRAAEQSGRSPNDVSLVAVSKLKPVEDILAALQAGQILFGENYVQEAKKKLDVLRERTDCPQPKVHLIGALQKNKVRRAVQLFDVIETVHSLELGQLIAEEAKRIDKIQQILVQINISEEETKSGVMPDDVSELVRSFAGLSNVSVLGLMCIGHWYEPSEAESVRTQDFVRMCELRELAQRDVGCELQHLSMGMSHDFELAIAHGATIVRVGSAIFGERPPKSAV